MSVQVATYEDLKAYLLNFGRTSCGAVPRSALHMAISGKAAAPAEPIGAWLPRRSMLCAALKLPAAGLPGQETELFVQQACLAVRILSFAVRRYQKRALVRQSLMAG